jgi:S-formylglutathione hydrolase FrmB
VTSDYYIDQPDYSIQEFIGHELPRAIQDEYFPEQPCEFCLAGISMGGYGSLLIGSLYPDSYRALLSISGAFITDDVLIGNPEVVGDGTDLRVTDYFRRIFAPYDQLEGSIRKNPAAAVDAATEHDGLPPIYMSCGTDDMLCSRNQKLLKHLRTKELDVTWEEIPGGQHDWDCFHHGFLALMEQMKLTDLP